MCGPSSKFYQNFQTASIVEASTANNIIKPATMSFRGRGTGANRGGGGGFGGRGGRGGFGQRDMGPPDQVLGMS